MVCGNNSFFCNIISLSESFFSMHENCLFSNSGQRKACVYTQRRHGQSKSAGSVLVCTIIDTELLNSTEQSLRLPLKKKLHWFEISFHAQQMNLQKKSFLNQYDFILIWRSTYRVT